MSIQIPQFDPLTIPVIERFHHLPAVSSSRLHPQALQTRFQFPPPWQPEIVQEAAFTQRKPQAAAVLIALVMREQPYVLLTQRASHLSTHSGQIAFPGGKKDESDLDIIHTAKREAFEEIGLNINSVKVIGRLPQYITGTQFYVTPVVAYLEGEIQLQANPQEVDDIFEVPLSFLMNPANHQLHQYVWQNNIRKWYSMPYDEPYNNSFKHRFIWGATAGMLRNLYHFLIA